ncbi:hypothetical protein ACOSP7_028900 [Xanthoceras sorbifolium]
MILHILILYVHPLSILFSVTPLSLDDWTVVLYLSFPVIIIDEVLKFFSRKSSGIFCYFVYFPLDLVHKSLSLAFMDSYLPVEA